MQITVSTQQIRHFSQFGWIELEDFLTEEECASLLASVKESAALRLNVPVPSLSNRSPAELYRVSRDLWRGSPSLQQEICSRKFTLNASSLCGVQTLILACDQWIPEGMLLTPLRMQEHLSFQNLACGCLVSLDTADLGHVRFCSPERLPLFSHSQLLIAYGSAKTIYVHNTNDPLNASLKQFGYEFGDRLVGKHHPFCKF